MRLKSFNGLLAILLLTSLVVPLLVTTAFAKPLEPNPEGVWPLDCVWGTKLRLENTYIGEAWFGAGPTAEKTEYFQALPDFMAVVFPEGGTMYDKIVKLSVTAPQSYSWYVKLYSGGVAPTAGTLSWVLENATHKFIPQDFSIVLDNASAGIHVNLRAKANQWFSLPTYATLHVDNAVNIVSIENLDPLSGTMGDTLRLRVTVQNTGEYTDNYRVWCDGGVLDPENWTGPVAEDASKSVTLTTTLPGGWDNIVVTAEGSYAKDVDYITATGLLVRKVEVNITPEENTGENGDTVTFDVCVKNTGAFSDNDNLTVDNIWSAWLSKYHLEDLDPGENEHITLFVKIPDNAKSGDSDTITVTATSKENENVSDNASCIARVAIAQGVRVTITPQSQAAGPCNWLEYTVHVVNTGNVADTYSLTVSDDLWWDDIFLDDEALWVDRYDNENTTLRVHIPLGTGGGTEDIIIVRATSQANPSVFAENICTAFVAGVRGVEVSISPSYQENLPGENLMYDITVRNTGNIADTYKLENRDNAGWTLILENTSLTIPPFENRTTKLTVTIPKNALPCTRDNIRVIATSRENVSVRAENNCIAHAAIVRRVDVSISPSRDNGLPGQTLSYTVKVTNKGNVMDNYDLTVSDNAGWSPSLSENLLENVLPGENRAITLTVIIPENAGPDTEDKITVTATSQENENVSDSATCIAYSLAITITRGVKVSISPNLKEGMPGSGLSYTIGVKNTGNVVDSYDLTVLDNLGWDLSLDENLLENVAADENRTTTLTVLIPENVEPSTGDNITVTATSRENAAVSDSATCLARALILRKVEITISPGYRNGPPGATLNYTVRVTNTGWAADNYRLVVSGTAGWLASIDPDSLALEPGESGEAALSVTVPPGVEGSSMIFYVWAISSVDPTVRASATCRALALEIGEGVGLVIPWVQILIIAALIAGAVFAAGYLTRRRGRERRRRIFRK